MRRAIVVGSGAGGAAAARELATRFEVTILEAGTEFKPFSWNLRALEKLRATGLFLDPRMIGLVFPKMRVRKSSGGVVVVTGKGTGGTTTLATGNAIHADAGLRELGIDLSGEFRTLARDIPISTEHQSRWRESTRELYAACGDLGLSPEPLPKMGDVERCAQCGKCVLGCPSGAKWDSRRFLADAIERGATLRTGWTVDKLLTSGGECFGVRARRGKMVRRFEADLVVLAAGGLGTPPILARSGIETQPNLFVDPVLCVATRRPEGLQNRELSMPFVVRRDRYIISPYFDWLSFFFKRAWRHPADQIVGLMIKLADVAAGSVTRSGRIRKELTDADNDGISEGINVCADIFARLGIARDDLFLGIVNAGHPGGMLPLTAETAESLHDPRLPANVYVADASLFPDSLGLPPILTIMALARRVVEGIPA